MGRGRALGDRIPRSVVVRASTGVRALLLALAAMAVGSGHLATAVVLATLVVASGTPAHPAIAAALPSTAGTRSETATRWLVTLEVSAFVVGPAVGGLLLSLLGAEATMASAALIGAGAALALAGVDLVDRWPDDHRGTGPAGLLGVIAGPADTVRVIAAVAAINVVIGAVGVTMLPMAERTWGDERAFGLVTAALGLGALATPVVRRLLRLPSTALRASFGLVVLPLAVVAAAPAWGWAVAPLVLLGAAATEVECVATTIMQRSVPDHARAFALGLTDTVMVTGAMIGASLAPWLAGTVGPRAVFAAFGAAASLLLPVVSAKEPAAQVVRAKTPQFT